MPLSCILCAIDLGVNITNLSNTDDSTIIFTLMDAIIFSVLTAVLTLCTIQLFALLTVLRHTSRREKWLIGAICALFTASYLSRSIYLIYEVFAIDMQNCSCCKQYWNTMWFLLLLPLFDVFPCAVVLLFDSIRIFSKPKNTQIGSGFASRRGSGLFYRSK